MPLKLHWLAKADRKTQGMITCIMGLGNYVLRIALVIKVFVPRGQMCVPCVLCPSHKPCSQLLNSILQSAFMLYIQLR
jgi:hypothetical protein